MKALLLFTLLFSVAAPKAFGKVDCKRHKLYCKIIKLQPTINKAFALKLSNKIYRKAKKYKMNPFLSLAIINQESSLRNLNSFKRSVIGETTHCSTYQCFKTTVIRQEILDLGITQINVASAKYYGFDIDKLAALNIDYALEAHFVILKEKIRECSRFGDTAWACYHSATPKHREKYIKAVRRFL